MNLSKELLLVLASIAICWALNDAEIERIKKLVDQGIQINPMSLLFHTITSFDSSRNILTAINYECCVHHNTFPSKSNFYTT